MQDDLYPWISETYIVTVIFELMEHVRLHLYCPTNSNDSEEVD